MAQFGLEHWLWEPGVVGSNPTAPTNSDLAIFSPIVGYTTDLWRTRNCSDTNKLSEILALWK